MAQFRPILSQDETPWLFAVADKPTRIVAYQIETLARLSVT